MTRGAFSVFAGVLAVALVACGGNESSGGGGSKNNQQQQSRLLTFEQAIVALFEAECQRAMRCAAEWGTVASDVATCVESALFMSEYGWANVSDYDKFVRVDAAKLEACFASYSDNCDGDLFEELGDECLELAVVGVARDGECCSYPGSCAPGLYCAFGQSDLGICRPKAQANEDCRDVECDSGLYCDNASETCKSVPGPEQPCGEERGSLNLVCDQSAYCDISGATPTCKARQGRGAFCMNNWECSSYLRCNADNKCAPYHVALGDSCTASSQCTPGADCVGAPGSKTCVARAKLGETCDPNLESAPDCVFLDALKCGTGGKCEPLPRLNEACQMGELCYPFDDVYCDQSDLTCKVRVPAWQACKPAADFAHSPCERGAECDPDLEVCIPAPVLLVTDTYCPGI